MEEKSFQKQSLSVDAPLCREEKAVEDEETEVQQRPLEGQGESRRRSSARRESAKKKRCNNRRHITTTLTTLVDSLTFVGTLKRKKRTTSCERKDDVTDESNKEETTADDDSNNLSTSTTPIVRRFSENHVRGLGQTDAEDEVDEAGFVQDHTDEGDPNYSSSRESAESQELERQEKYYLKGMSKLKELLSTEATYVESSLCQVVDGYYRYMEDSKVDPEGRIKIPQDLLGGKDSIIFGNIRDLYEFHKKTMYPFLMKCSEDPRMLRNVFESKRDILKQKYGKFCLNKPKSEFIISQHNDKYFAVLRLKLDFAQSLSAQMMTPIQRVTRYQLLLRDMEKSFRQAGVPDMHADVLRAYEIAHEIAEYANNMMSAGRISGFEGNVTAQGLLLRRGKVSCFKSRTGVNRRQPKERNCQLFVFQETIIACEQPPETGASFPQNLEYFASFKMNKVVVREMTKGFELERKDDGSSAKDSGRSSVREQPSAVVVLCQSIEERNQWLKTINDQIRELKDIAKRLENPQLFEDAR